MKDPPKLRESWHAVYGGTVNTGRIAVLEEGVKYQQIAIPPEKAQFLETRKFQIDEIVRIYRVPPHMIGDLEQSSFNNIEQQSLEFVKYTLNPWVVRWEQSLQKALFTDKEREEYFIRFKVDGLCAGTTRDAWKGTPSGGRMAGSPRTTSEVLRSSILNGDGVHKPQGLIATGQISLTQRRQTSRRTSFFPSSTRSSVLTARMRRFLFEEAVQTLKMKG